MRLLNVYPETISDGPGLRYSIYLSGCRHECPGCHNVESWDASRGIPLSDVVLSDIVEQICANELLDGITVSGGDPFYNPKELLWLVRNLRERTHLNIWCYTGYTIEYILAHEEYRAVLDYIDVLVDGPYVASLRDPYLRFRGSSNQRLLRIPHDQAISMDTVTLLP